MKKRNLVIFLILFTRFLYAQELARFLVIPGELETESLIVCVPIDQALLSSVPEEILLFEILEGEEIPITSQVERTDHLYLWFVLNEHDLDAEVREFVIKPGNHSDQDAQIMNIITSEDSVVLSFKDTPVLSYHHHERLPPEGVSPLYKRSAFIHPLFSPSGDRLTRIQPPDHYHHYGIWNPWTKTRVLGEEVDFWNLAKGQGTVIHIEYISKSDGNLYSGFKAHHEHIILGDGLTKKKAIDEIWDVRAWDVGEAKVRIVDLTATLSTPIDSGILLAAYRYGGGIGYRATERWHKDNCSVFTSESKDRANADGSHARWCIVEGESDAAEGRSGILFLSHPSNRMHPEPMRVWPPDANKGRGDMFFEFCPIRHKDWKLEPDKYYTLKYRMIIFDGKMDQETAEKYWNSFAFLPGIEFIKQNKK